MRKWAFNQTQHMNNFLKTHGDLHEFLAYRKKKSVIGNRLRNTCQNTSTFSTFDFTYFTYRTDYQSCEEIQPFVNIQ